MSRSKKKKTLSQKVVGAATSGMPSPIRSFLNKPLIALLIVLLLPVLYATGVVSVSWENGRPRLSFDRQKAAEVKQNATEKIQELRSEQTQGQGLLSIRPADHSANPPSFTLNPQSDTTLGDHSTQRFSLLPASNEKESQNSQENRPAPRLKQLFKR